MWSDEAWHARKIMAEQLRPAEGTRPLWSRSGRRRLRNGKPISIPYLVDLEHDRRKPSDEVLEQLAKVLKVDSDLLYYLAGRIPSDLTAKNVKEEDLTAAWKAFRREVERTKKT